MIKANINLKEMPNAEAKILYQKITGNLNASQGQRGYKLPMATEDTLGGVKAVLLDEETGEKIPVYIDRNGKLWITATGDKNYIYDQISLSTIWTIEHNLNKYPSVTVKDTGGNSYTGEVVYLSPNKLEVHFSVPISGRAYLN